MLASKVGPVLSGVNVCTYRSDLGPYGAHQICLLQEQLGGIAIHFHVAYRHGLDASLNA